MDYASERQSQARRAYGNPLLSVKVHGLKMEEFNVEIRKNGAMKNRSLILACLTGLCTSAVTSAAALGSPKLFYSLLNNAGHSSKLMMWTMTTGVGLAFVVTTCFTLERSIYDLELSRELWEIENHLAGELQEMISIYKNQGLSEEEALIVTKIFSKQKTLFAKLMMVEELGYSRLEPPTTKEAFLSAGAPIVAGYMLGFMVPLLPLVGSVRAIANGGATADAKAGGLSAAMLLLGTVGASMAQTEIFFGAYAHTSEVLKATASNIGGVIALYGISYLVSRYL